MAAISNPSDFTGGVDLSGNVLRLKSSGSLESDNVESNAFYEEAL